MKTQFTLALSFAAVFGITSNAMAQEPPKVDADLDAMKTVNICVDYHYLKSDSEKARYKKELDRRGMLSHTDYDHLGTPLVEPGSTMCGMYMTLGKPLAEQSKQLRPMVFKVVHVYPKHYYVSQMGVVLEKYERKEGELPPKLTQETPAVQAPPMMMHAPGGTHHP